MVRSLARIILMRSLARYLNLTFLQPENDYPPERAIFNWALIPDWFGLANWFHSLSQTNFKIKNQSRDTQTRFFRTASSLLVFTLRSRHRFYRIIFSAQVCFCENFAFGVGFTMLDQNALWPSSKPYEILQDEFQRIGIPFLWMKKNAPGTNPCSRTRIGFRVRLFPNHDHLFSDAGRTWAGQEGNRKFQ